MPAVIGGPHGRFNHVKGTARQVWIAGGVGVAPFLSWLRALDAPLEQRVDFFYTSVGAAPFAEEILAIAEGQDRLRVHVIDSHVDGRLTPTEVLASVGAPADELSVFMCGPQGMLSAFTAQFRAAGIPARRMHREYFDWR